MGRAWLRGVQPRDLEGAFGLVLGPCSYACLGGHVLTAVSPRPCPRGAVSVICSTVLASTSAALCASHFTAV